MKTTKQKSEPFLTLNFNILSALVMAFIISFVVNLVLASIIAGMGLIDLNPWGILPATAIASFFLKTLISESIGLSSGGVGMLIFAIAAAYVAKKMKITNDLSLRGIVFGVFGLIFGLMLFEIFAFLATSGRVGYYFTSIPSFFIWLFGLFRDFAIQYMLLWCIVNYEKVKPHLKNIASYAAVFGLLLIIYDSISWGQMHQTSTLTGIMFPISLSGFNPYSIYQVQLMVYFVINLAVYAGALMAYATSKKEDKFIWCMPLAMVVLRSLFAAAETGMAPAISASSWMVLFATAMAFFIFASEKDIRRGYGLLKDYPDEVAIIRKEAEKSRKAKWREIKA